ncbi:MAG: OmpA family protein, partial [Amphritea sp.]|nr:OmpA family protein [Amphritea sp.]
VLFECDTQQCGGYDFRFETEVLQAPAMHVDLGDYRFISAQKGDDEHLSLLVSRSANAGFVQMIWVHTSIRDQAGQAVQGPSASAAVREGVASSEASVPQLDHAEGTVRVLQTAGHVVLDDLAFETGSADLGAGPYKSLLQLSAFLNANAGKRVALVGHTDAVGTLERNINLSKRRAAS